MSGPLRYDPALSALIGRAGDRVRRFLATEVPTLGAALGPWLATLSRGGPIEDYFTHHRRFPMLLLPWWAAEAAGSRGALAFHEEVIYSTICAYLEVRLIDDLVDRRGEPGLELIPAAAALHTECLHPYLGHFPAGSPFWTFYRSRWLAAVDAAVDPPGEPRLTTAAFGERAARRLGPATIPIAAVAIQAGRPELIEPWCRFTLALARVEQLLDDFTDWHHDAERGLGNLLLAEGERRRRPDEPVEAWVIREGLRWALGTLETWLTELSPPGPGATGFVAARRALVGELRGQLEPGLRQLDALARAFDDPRA